MWLTFALAGGRKHLLAAFTATALVATYPPLLGHAGLATTDLAAVATVLLFLFCLDRWADAPTHRRAAAVGAAFGVAALCKLTAPAFCLPLGGAWLLARRMAKSPLPHGQRLAWTTVLAQIGIAGAVAFMAVWACYRFSVGRLDDLPPMTYIGTPVLPPAAERSAFMAWLCRLRLPAPEFWDGFLFLKAHDKHGHPAFLLGQIRDRGGFWDFYLVGLLLKSPLSFLALLVACLPALLRKRTAPLDARALGAGLAAVVALALSTLLTVNIGLRHLLIAVPLLAIFIAGAVTPWVEELAQRERRTRLVAPLALAALLAAGAVTVETARPQLMAYFNPLAGREPSHALIDSDLDWGQDFLLLKRELRARQISSAHYGFFGTMNPCSPDLPQLLPLVPKAPETGWIVLSEQFYRSDFFLNHPPRILRLTPLQVRAGAGRLVRLAEGLRAGRPNRRDPPAVLRTGGAPIGVLTLAGAGEVVVATALRLRDLAHRLDERALVLVDVLRNPSFGHQSPWALPRGTAILFAPPRADSTHKVGGAPLWLRWAVAS